MTNQAMTTLADHQIAELTIKDIKSYICANATDAEAMAFLRLCQAQGLNPWLREAYLIKYDGVATMIVGKETFTKRAENHPHFRGYRAGVIVADSDGGILEREGTFYTNKEMLAGGWAEVYRDDRQMAIKATVILEEYSSGKSNWKSKPATMIRKVALVQALREAFPVAFAGLYDAAEMGVSDDALEGEVIRREDAPSPEQPRRSNQRPAARAVDVPAEPVQRQQPAPPTLTHCPEHPEAELMQSLMPDQIGPGHPNADVPEGWCDAATVINSRLLAVLATAAKNRADVDALLASKGRPVWGELTLAQQHLSLGWLQTQFAKQFAAAAS